MCENHHYMPTEDLGCVEAGILNDLLNQEPEKKSPSTAPKYPTKELEGSEASIIKDIINQGPENNSPSTAPESPIIVKDIETQKSDIRLALMHLLEDENKLARGKGKNKRAQHRKFEATAVSTLGLILEGGELPSTEKELLSMRKTIVSTIQALFPDDSKIQEDAQKVFRDKTMMKNR